jgi:hypothetical protein
MSRKKDKPIYTASIDGLATIWGGVANCLTLEEFRALGQPDTDAANAERYHSATAGGCGDFVDLEGDGLEAQCRGHRCYGGTCRATWRRDELDPAAWRAATPQASEE